MSATALGIILGGVITVIVSLFFYILQKRAHYPGELKLAVADFKRIVSKDHSNLDKLSLKYEDYEVNQNLVYFELIITNDRSFDIRSDDTTSPISLSLPSESKWIDVQVKSCSKNVFPKVSLEGDKCCNISWPLLRKGEFVVLAGLIETSSIYSDEKLLGSVDISHRIPNMSSVKKVSIGDIGFYKKIISTSWFYLAVMSILLLVSLIVPIRLSNIKYLDTVSNTQVSLFVDKNDSLVLYHSLFKLERIPSKDLNTRFIPVYSHDRNKAYVYWIALAFMSIFVAILVTDYVKLSKSKKIINLTE